MRRLLVAVLALAPAVLPAQAAETGVDVRDNSFSPATVTIVANDTVRWTHRGQALHTVTADDGSFEANLLPGTSFTHTFTRAGTVAYRCEFHPSMRGTVVVQAAPPSPTATTRPATSTTRRTTTTLPPGESAITAPGERAPSTTTSSSVPNESTTTTTSVDGTTATTTDEEEALARRAGQGDGSGGQPSHAGPTALAALLLAGVSGGAAFAVKRGL